MVNEAAVNVSPLMNTYQRIPLTFTKGEGSYLWDEKGEVYLDFTAGIATCNLGHVPKAVKEAVSGQLDNLWHCSNLFQIKNQEKLAAILAENSCMDQVFFCNSGAEANEAAIKLARKYANEAGKNACIVSFKQSFHGRTLAALSATGQEKIQTGFAPLMPGFHYLPYNNSEGLSELEIIKPCAVMLELVQGEGGVIPAEQEWIDELAAICKRNNILLIVDEVQTGMGRTGSMFAYEQYGFEPDIMTLAKGLASGFPIGAMLAKEKIAAVFTPGSHGSTFGGNPIVTAAGLATVKEILGCKLINNVKIQEQWLMEKLEHLKCSSPFIKQIRGKGLLIGIEVNIPAAAITEQALKERLLILTAGPNVVRILPPLTVTQEEMILFINKLQRTLKVLEDQQN